jgi:hypothetical protein
MADVDQRQQPRDQEDEACNRKNEFCLQSHDVLSGDFSSA